MECHSSNLGHCGENSGSLTFCATNEHLEPTVFAVRPPTWCQDLMKLRCFCFVAARIWHEAKHQVKSEFIRIRPSWEMQVSWPGSRAAERTKRATFMESKEQWGREKTAFFLISSFGGG